MNIFNSLNSNINHCKNTTQNIDSPIINSVSYPSNTSATIFFTPSTSSDITDYKYSLDSGDTYTTTGFSTTGNYYFTVDGLTGAVDLYLYAVKDTTYSQPSIYNITPSYTPKGTIVEDTGNPVGIQLISNTYEYYVFTDTNPSSTLSFSTNTSVEYVIVGAGGNGGADHGGGGGAGGVIYGNASISASDQIGITVGKPANANFETAISGGNSTIIFNSTTTTITANGGGVGASAYNGGSEGGSGGGSASFNFISPTNGISGQGNNGGNYGGGNCGGGGGGGGAGGIGGNGGFINGIGGEGGSGGAGTNLYSEWIIFISNYMNTIYTNWSEYTISNGIGYIASGGAGGAYSVGDLFKERTLRTIGGGGDGGTSGDGGITRIYPTNGIPNTGGGGGGLGGNHAGYGNFCFQGGSGIVIIRVMK